MKSSARKLWDELGFKLPGSALLLGLTLAGGIAALSVDSGSRALTKLGGPSSNKWD